jgi:hypothetical protein
LVFTTLQLAGPRKYALGLARSAVTLGVVVLLARRGGPRWPARAYGVSSAIALALSAAINLGLWLGGPHRGRSDPRKEVVIPEHFLPRLEQPVDTPEYRAAVKQLRSELGLSWFDTLKALATIGDRNRRAAATAADAS